MTSIIEEMASSIELVFHNTVKQYALNNIERITSTYVDNEYVIGYWRCPINIYSMEWCSLELYAILVHTISKYVNITKKRIHDLGIPDTLISQYARMLPDNISGVHDMIQNYFNTLPEFATFSIGESNTVESRQYGKVYDVIMLDWSDLGYLQRQYDVLNAIVNKV